jgi:O-acetyl-ADP-ribose deacetylase
MSEPHETRIGERTLEIVEADITTLRVDAIVNAANDQLWMGSGVAGAIKRKGGADIEKEAIGKGPIAIGDAISTRSGKLPAACVIHAAVMGQDLRTSPQIVARATRSALALAAKLGCRTLAIPAFGTGVGGLASGACAEAMLPVVLEALRGATPLDRVTLAVFGRPTYDAFVEVLARLIA